MGPSRQTRARVHELRSRVLSANYLQFQLFRVQTFSEFKLFGIDELEEFCEELVSRGDDSQGLQGLQGLRDSQDSPSSPSSPSLPSSQSSGRKLGSSRFVSPHAAQTSSVASSRKVGHKRGAPPLLRASRRP